MQRPTFAIDLRCISAYPMSMTAQEVVKQIQDKIGPQLQELGVVAMSMVAYIELGDGKIQKIQLGVDGQNPAYADGLRTMHTLGERWGRGEL